MGRPLRTTTFTEPGNLSDVLKYELGTICREVGTIPEGNGKLDIGMVLAKIAGTATSAAKSGGNTGTGTCVLDATTPVLPGARTGVYKLRFTSTTNIRLEGPDGVVLGDTTIGTSNGNSATISEQIKAVITQNVGTAFAVGDGFDITVAEGAATWIPYVAGAVAAGVLLSKVDTTDGDAQAVILARGPAEVSNLGLKWDASVDSTAKKLTAIGQLTPLGIVTRTSA